jgi:selenoprotein W-related protein
VVIRPGAGGILEVTLEGEVIASNRDSKQMPELNEVKRAIRDRIAPGRRIGHSQSGDV